MSLARLVIGPKEAGGGGGAAIISDPEKDVDNYHYIFCCNFFSSKGNGCLAFDLLRNYLMTRNVV